MTTFATSVVSGVVDGFLLGLILAGGNFLSVWSVGSLVGMSGGASLVGTGFTTGGRLVGAFLGVSIGRTATIFGGSEFGVSVWTIFCPVVRAATNVASAFRRRLAHVLSEGKCLYFRQFCKDGRWCFLVFVAC